MNLLIFLGLSFQCMLNHMSYASSIHIRPGWDVVQSRPASERQLKRFLRELTKNEEEYIDPRILALSWVESRIRPRVRRGDRGKACGMFQIHARYSYPMFRRRRGFNGWVEEEQKEVIGKECRKLESIRYSVKTVEKLLGMMDKRDLHPCHHNSGFYGRCNTWYKQRVDYWTAYFKFANFICNERIVKIMAMMRTGNPIPTAPATMIQGYLDAMGGKEPHSEDTTYKSGYDLAKLVQEGKAQAPSWATEDSNSTSTTSEGTEREG
jgi:hypothetical protein